jgi:hypothetical protein
MTITWNYRVFKEANGDLIIREVFYDQNGSILGCTENSVEPFGHSLEELSQDIQSLQAALSLPILTLDDIPIKKVNKKVNVEKTDNISHDQLMAELGMSSQMKNNIEQ